MFFSYEQPTFLHSFRSPRSCRAINFWGKNIILSCSQRFKVFISSNDPENELTYSVQGKFHATQTGWWAGGGGVAS